MFNMTSSSESSSQIG